MHICAILIAKPSMQVLYERVLRRPYPRSQRHVYIGMSQTLAVPQIRSFSMTFPFHTTFLFRENNMSCLFSSLQKKSKKNSYCYAILFHHCSQMSLSLCAP